MSRRDKGSRPGERCGKCGRLPRWRDSALARVATAMRRGQLPARREVVVADRLSCERVVHRGSLGMSAHDVASDTHRGISPAPHRIEWAATAHACGPDRGATLLHKRSTRRDGVLQESVGEPAPAARPYGRHRVRCADQSAPAPETARSSAAPGQTCAHYCAGSRLVRPGAQ